MWTYNVLIEIERFVKQILVKWSSLYVFFFKIMDNQSPISGKIYIIQNIENLYLKSLDPILRKILWTRRKQSFVYTNNQYSSFPIVHTSNLRKIQNKKHATVNWKYWVTRCFVTQGFGLRTFIVEQTDSVNNKTSKLFS